MKFTEKEIAAKIVDRLRLDGWDVYQEVSLGQGYPRPDIVATQGSLLWIVECKKTLGQAVIDQAHYWLGRANLVSIAVGSRRVARWVEEYCEWKGIGISVNCAVSPYSVVSPRLWRVKDERDKWIRDALREEQKTWAAAGTQSGYYTDFAGTCQRIREVLRYGPLALKPLVGLIRHHYGSDAVARSCILSRARQGIIRGVSVIEGRPLMLQLEKEK